MTPNPAATEKSDQIADYPIVTPECLLKADPRLRVRTLGATERPNQIAWMAMHQCYSEGSVIDNTPPPEPEAGEALLKHLLAGGRGHFGPLEHPQITIATAGFPHSVMQQARTHRVAVSFDVQSSRYTGDRFKRMNPEDEGYDPDSLHISDLVYFRPVGRYKDRQGNDYVYEQTRLHADEALCVYLAQVYSTKLSQGFAEEHARSLIPFDFRQNFVVSFNLRSLMHFLDLRAKLDAQLEIQALCELLMVEFHKWTPEVARWYMTNRWGKARLAP